MTDARVLLLMDGVLGNLVRLTLRHCRYEIREEIEMEAARAAVRTFKPRVVLADADRFPEGSSLVGGRKRTIPYIGLTRKRDTAQKLAFFQHGADDIIEVPFRPDEIVVRTIATLDRVHGMQADIQPKITTGGLEIDLLKVTVSAGGKALSLTPLEHALLYLFAANPGKILSRDAILNNVWGPDYVVASNVIDRHIRDLRVKLGDTWRKPRFLETVPGRGYRFIGDQDRVGVAAT